MTGYVERGLMTVMGMSKESVERELRDMNRFSRASPGDDDDFAQPDHRSHAYHVYADLLHRHMKALREGQEELRIRLFAAIELIREVYPEQVYRFELDYPTGEAVR